MIVMKAYAVRRARTSIEMIPLHNINLIQQKTNGQIHQANKGKEQPKTIIIITIIILSFLLFFFYTLSCCLFCFN